MEIKSRLKSAHIVKLKAKPLVHSNQESAEKKTRATDSHGTKNFPQVINLNEQSYG